MATTLAQITTEFYNIVNAIPDDGSGKNTVYTLEFVENLANIVQRDLCLGWNFPFTRKKTLFKTALNTTVSADIATTDVTISVGATTEYATSGAIWIEHDVVNYTGTTATSFTGCTNIDIAHTSGVAIEPLYTLPTDFSQDPSLWVGTGSNNVLKEYRYVPSDEFDNTIETLIWTIVTSKAGVEYIRINNPSSSVVASFEYNKTPATMTVSVDAIIPDQFALSVIPRVMAGTAMIIRDDNPDDLGRIIGQVGEKDRLRMKNYYSMRIGALSVPFKTKYRSTAPIRSFRINRTYG